MKRPQTRYAASDDVRIAYRVIGHGPVDLVFVPGFISNLDVEPEDAGYSRLVDRLAAFSRLILFDKRGSGLSDRVDPDRLPDLEARSDDVRAAMDAAGSGRAALLGSSDGAAVALRFAASHPERTRALVLHGAYARFRGSVAGADRLERLVAATVGAWGSGSTVDDLAPGRAEDAQFREWWARFERLSASPTAAAALLRMHAAVDLRDILGLVRAPTLVLHRSGDGWVRPAAGRALAAAIEGARFVELPGRDHAVWTADVDRLADEIGEFLTGTRPLPAADRVLSTLLLARPVPTRTAAHSTEEWSERLARLREAAGALFAQHGGRGFAAGAEEIAGQFAAPARALRCALELRSAAERLALDLAAGVHSGEIALRDETVEGIVLHVAERVAAHAARGEILASAVVTDLVAGSGLRFAERPACAVEGLDAVLRVFAVQAEQHLEPAPPLPRTPNLAVLSTREREVLGLIAEGLSNAAIAGRLRLSDHTVKRHVANILLKLDLPTRAAAAALLARQETG